MDLNEPIKNVMAIMANQLSVENIDTELDLDQTLLPIFAHKNRIEQLVYNLVTNAFQAIDKSKQAGNSRVDNHIIKIRTFKENSRAVISIEDSGIGISKKQVKRIFEPFYTTNAPGNGKGLGLTISKEIVRGYGGRITVENRQSGGAVFRITFPCAEPEKNL